ncbi:MAG: YtxH domain-containing protein [Nitrospirae bacterium]|nr:YtxH domain-containing protein [Candidatus Manganitrophaceae bacterium]
MKGESRFAFGLLMFLAGLAAGALAGVLFAPRSGRETQKDLRGLANETGKRFGRITEKTRESLAGAADQGKQWANDAQEHLKSIGQAASKVVDEGREFTR